MPIDASMREIYSEMRSRNLAKLQAGSFGCDVALQSATDSRRCLAMYSLFDESAVHWTPAFGALRAELAESFPEHVLYTEGTAEGARQGKLHYTTLQLVGFNAYGGEPLPPQYGAVVASVLREHYTAFKLCYIGIIAVPTGLLMISVPDIPINALRDRLREGIKAQRLPFHEPYYNDIVHSTLLRLNGELTDEQKAKMLDVAARYAECELGTVDVNEITLNSASWRMQADELFGGLQMRLRPAASTRVITHRGLEPSQKDFFSESTFDAFQNHLDRGFSIEFDPSFTSDGVVVFHDATLARLTGGADDRQFADVTTAEALALPMRHGRMATLDELLLLIAASAGNCNALHFKGDRQQPENQIELAQILRRHPKALAKLIVFDVRPDTARYLTQAVPGVRLAASVSHAHDIARYGAATHHTLLSLDEVIALRDVISWVWLDEWDLSGPDGATKVFVCADTIKRLREHKFMIGCVTPELHSTSPGLLGGESHPDAADHTKLMSRVKDIVALGLDALCTDYPEAVVQMF